MNILITGCNGQLGNELRLIEKNYPQHTFFNTDVNELDITDAEAIGRFVSSNSIDVIINCAAYTAVDKAESNSGLCRTLNAEAPAYLAEAVAKRNGRMIQVSTDYVFDGTNTRHTLRQTLRAPTAYTERPSSTVRKQSCRLVPTP